MQALSVHCLNLVETTFLRYTHRVVDGYWSLMLDTQSLNRDHPIGGEAQVIQPRVNVSVTAQTTGYIVVVAFSSRARILGECSTIHPPSLLRFFKKRRLARAH